MLKNPVEAACTAHGLKTAGIRKHRQGVQYPAVGVPRDQVFIVPVNTIEVERNRRHPLLE